MNTRPYQHLQSDLPRAQASTRPKLNDIDPRGADRRPIMPNITLPPRYVAPLHHRKPCKSPDVCRGRWLKDQSKKQHQHHSHGIQKIALARSLALTRSANLPLGIAIWSTRFNRNMRQRPAHKSAVCSEDTGDGSAYVVHTTPRASNLQKPSSRGPPWVRRLLVALSRYEDCTLQRPSRKISAAAHEGLGSVCRRAVNFERTCTPVLQQGDNFVELQPLSRHLGERREQHKRHPAISIHQAA
mmetsp:Transcript_84334/g.168383  ORF Transcript_84334/g.168383 Transcript_84334/m.168383 type:complete len:242 (-) Transcript_84334:299-1024(-)